ncbi:MAG: 16S rRNA (cytosine(967)-C(5))-methyltransferase RsmB [Pseudomonadota bacterium]
MAKLNLPKHRPQLRADAAWALYQVLDKGRSSQEILPTCLSRFQDAKDKAWFQECFYGCLRDVPLYQHWTNHLLSKPINEKNRIVERVIMVGLMQLHTMRTPDHAAISETVNAVKIIGMPKFSGVINAILRRFLRDNISQIPVDMPHVRYGMPKWLLKQIQSDYPDDWETIAINSNRRAPIFLRINRMAVKPEAFKKALQDDGVAFEEITETCIKLEQTTNIVDLPGYEEGAFSVQDQAAQHAAMLLDAQENDLVLDCCAAPGGKASAIYERTPTLAKLIALDNNDNRISRMKENFLRLKHQDARIEMVLDDASKLDCIDKDIAFNRILLDAPCSATGIIRRHPDIKWLRKRTDIDALVILQKKILELAWQRLKEGGTLLYATCSILHDENVAQIQQFLKEHDNAQWIRIRPKESIQQPGWQILPGENDMDGFYYAKLKKLDSESPITEPV